MKILIATLAESANISSSGKLQIRGVLDSLVAPKGFPCTLPPVTVVLHFELSPDDGAHDHALRIDVRSDDGNILASVPETHQAPKINSGRRVVENEIIPLQLDEPVTRPGRLTFEIFWDDVKQHGVELEILG